MIIEIVEVMFQMITEIVEVMSIKKKASDTFIPWTHDV